ncbi:MAG: thiosulfate/3-mercaptopyruvate sulfurtransferase [Cryptosporangiaceae bacterium]|nr:thiosulfate/3-mercaptopyruvate sulfurtransferase [Cryptosporangiaceae bacterium]
MFGTVVSGAEAEKHLGDHGWVFVDCRYVLADAEAGRRAYTEAHLPGSRYADLEQDLSGPVIPGRTGRHPLPGLDHFAETATSLGIGPDTQVVAYDAGSGAMAAARLWWLLQWAGHDAVAVLDGGLANWIADGRPATSDPSPEPHGPAFVPRERPGLVARAAELASHPLADARAEDRFRGENETVDPVAGHIPGAVSLPFAGNLGPDGTLRPAAELRDRYAALAEQGDPVFYCGSGVTAALDVLAYRHAGLGMPRLYPGSWSEWITDPARPVAR